MRSIQVELCVIVAPQGHGSGAVPPVRAGRNGCGNTRHRRLADDGAEGEGGGGGRALAH